MTTMNQSLKVKLQSFVNNNSQNTDNGNQYSDFCLNQNHKSSGFSPIQSKSKSYKDKIFDVIHDGTAPIFELTDSTVSDICEGKEKSVKRNKSPKLSILSTLNDSIEVKKIQKCWKKDSNATTNNNNSTLSLHISAYENFVDTVSNEFNGKNNESLEKEKSKTIINKKQIFDASTFVFQNPFEFPRQENGLLPNPEISKYKACQRLINPNEATNNDQQDMTSKVTHLTQTEAEHVCRAKVILKVTAKKYPNLVLDGIAPKTEEEREKATESFFEWIDDNCRFMEEHVENYHILSKQVEIDEQNVLIHEKSDADAYFHLLSAMDRTMIVLKDILEELDAINTYLLSFYSHSTSLIRRHINFVEKMQGDEETLDIMFENFKFEPHIEIGGNSAELFERIKKLENDQESSSSSMVAFAGKSSNQKNQQKGGCNVAMKWSMKNMQF